MRIHFAWVFAGILLLGSVRVAKARGSGQNADGKPLIYTGVTGSINASGLDDPQYVLSFFPVQRLMLQATRHPLTKADIDTAVHGTPGDPESPPPTRVAPGRRGYLSPQLSSIDHGRPADNVPCVRWLWSEPCAGFPLAQSGIRSDFQPLSKPPVKKD